MLGSKPSVGLSASSRSKAYKSVLPCAQRPAAGMKSTHRIHGRDPHGPATRSESNRLAMAGRLGEVVTGRTKSGAVETTVVAGRPAQIVNLLDRGSGPAHFA